jgi:hypothetical protein
VRSLALIALLTSARVLAAAEPETLVGRARVIDGDTFAVGTTVVRLADVEAPEMAQQCDGGPSALRHCGAYVADALKERIGDREVRCAVRQLDQYDRRISTCEVVGAAAIAARPATAASTRSPGSGTGRSCRPREGGRGDAPGRRSGGWAAGSHIGLASYSPASALAAPRYRLWRLGLLFRFVSSSLQELPPHTSCRRSGEGDANDWLIVCTGYDRTSRENDCRGPPGQQPHHRIPTIGA